MRMRTKLRLLILLVALIVIGFLFRRQLCDWWKGHEHGTQDPGCTEAKACIAKHAFTTAAAAPPADDECPIIGCGLNGAWLGNGVPFRTLHINGTRVNERGLAI